MARLETTVLTASETYTRNHAAQNERVDRGSRCCQMAARNGGLLYRLKGPVGLGMSFVGVNVIVG